jgi:putative membrane protein insertion efficiency factor
LPVGLIKLYQFISPIFGQKCRYYPTCSEYAKWEFETDNLFFAFFKSIFRILRCNQFFSGGIDYPVIKKKINPIYKKDKIKYWLIPKGDKFIVIKAYNE